VLKSQTFTPPAVSYTISSQSLTDVTDLVSNGTLSIHTNGTVLHASYARKSFARAAASVTSLPQDLLSNGSFTVDHFSQAGAKLTTAFLEKFVFIDGIRELMTEVGNYVWEDSVEIPSLVFWTPELESEFESQHGVRSATLMQNLAKNRSMQSVNTCPC
jgi:hypothetical protein